MNSFMAGAAAGALMTGLLAHFRIKDLVRRHQHFLRDAQETFDRLIAREVEIARLAAERQDRSDPGFETELGEALAQSLQRSQPSSVQPWFDNIGPLDGVAR